MKKLLFGNIDNPITTDFVLTLVRIFTGLSLMLAHGTRKIPVSDGFIEHVGEIGFPVPFFFAWAAALSEYVGALLMAIGLFTRPASFFVVITMFSAAFVKHANDPFGAAEKAYLFLAISAIFMVIGAGRYSVDTLIRRKLNL